LQNIIAGPDGKIYTSGYVIGLLGILDPQTRETKQISGVKQAEGVTAYQSQLYFGTYPGANISVFDTALPVSKTNPRTLFSLKEDEQDRPFGMLGVPEEKKVFTGTVPAYGLLGGVLSVYDVETDKHKVFRDVVPKQSLISFAYKNGLLYCGTTISGGLGIEPTEKEPKLFIWDIKQEKKIFECSPVPDRKGISGLQFAPDGNLWGWAQGTLFIFDPVERKVIFNEEKISYTGEFRHFWRGGYMTNGNDGNFYGTLFGNVYKLNQATREFVILAKGGDLELICRDAEGRLYFVKRDQLYRLVPKKQ